MKKNKIYRIIFLILIIINCATIFHFSSQNGDISGNGQIDLYDAVIISKYLLGMVELSEEEIQIADYNGDGSVDLYDAISIAEYLLENLQK